MSKKSFYLLVFTVLACAHYSFANDKPQPAGWVNDFANVIPQEYRDKLNTLIQELGEQFTMIFRTLGSLINPHSDTGLSKLSGAVGIVHYIHDAAQVGLPLVMMLTVLLNVNLAVLNLLPIPVLDGGQILFATLARLRGRALPANFIITTQSVFVVLILAMMVYVSVFDVRRWVRDAAIERVAGEK